MSERDRDAYARAAAVLVSVRAPEKLRPAGKTETSALAALGRDLRRSTARAFRGEYVLDSAARSQALEQMSPRDIRSALELNPKERTGPGQRLYEQILLGKAPNIEKLEGGELEMAVQVMTWLQDLRPLDDELEAANARLEYSRYLSPFQALASDQTFVGRVDELDRLRSHVGVMSPKGLGRRVLAVVSRFMEVRPALTVYGPGGVGKSTLIARFALDHLSMPATQRIPLAYLDFDRPDRDIADVVGLASEMIRQIRAQRGGSLYDDLAMHAENIAQLEGEDAGDAPEDPAVPQLKAKESTSGDRQSAEPGAAQDRSQIDVQLQIEMASTLLNQLLELLVAEQAPSPMVLILDSFEEVQYRNEARAQSLWDVIGRLSHPQMQVRTVICGRAPVRSLQWNGLPAEDLEIGQLDELAASEFLRIRGFKDAREREAIANVVGRVPLSLVLAATLLKSEENSARVGLKGVQGKRKFWFSAADEVIQGQLYERILGHIHNPRVCKLAHPGLVLRRVTPDLIAEVLNGPCALGVTTLEDANSLFAELKRETSLVTIDDAEDAVVHRRDLRAVMLRLIEAKEPELVRTIHASAAAYYEKRPQDLRSRAEYCYHALHLGYFPERWLADSEVRGSIQASISDFTPEVQEDLFRVGFLRERGTRALDVNRKNDELIAFIEQALPYARSALRQRIPELVKAFDRERSLRVALSGWRMFAEIGDSDEAINWMDRADEAARLEPDSTVLLPYLSDKCWHLYKAEMRGEPLLSMLGALEEHGRRQKANWALAQSYLLDQILLEGGRSAAAQSGLALKRLDPLELWSIFPVLGAVCLFNKGPPRGQGWDLSVWFHVAKSISGRSSPFVRADEDRSFKARQELVSMAQRFTKTGARGDKEKQYADLAWGIAHVARGWPYQVLRVQPAYGSNAHYLRESST